MAYYRTGWLEEHRHLLNEANPNHHFWLQVNENFLDMCVLEWCKLFGSDKEKHHWSNVVTDARTFEAELLRHLGINDQQLKVQVKIMLRYRDQWVAHQDYKLTGLYPTLELPKKAIWFYYTWIVEHEGYTPSQDFPFAEQLDDGYDKESLVANVVYEIARQRCCPYLGH
jgi:hypothetical protein